MSSKEVKLKRSNKILTFLSIILFIVIAVIVGLIFGKTLSNISINEYSKQLNCDNKAVKFSKLNGIYEYNNDIKMKITFLENDLMRLESTKNNELLEYTEGTYELRNNKLTFNRVYTSMDKIIFKKEINNLPSKVIFKYDKYNNSLKINSYMDINEEIILSSE